MIALLARAIERHPAERSFQVTRLTVDMMKAAPMMPLQTRARVVRSGKNVDFVEASLLAGGKEVGRATAMRFRMTEIEVPDDVPGSGAVAVVPRLESEEFTGWGDRSEAEQDAFHHALDVRPVPGFETPTVWMRFRVPLVEGEENSPLIRVAVAGDFAYSVPVMRRVFQNPTVLQDSDFAAINPDTSFNLHRPLEGEWVYLDSRAFYDSLGAGTVIAHLHDDRGPLGHVSQSILVRGAEKRPEAMVERLG
jgi:hypothetical protein